MNGSAEKKWGRLTYTILTYTTENERNRSSFTWCAIRHPV